MNPYARPSPWTYGEEEQDDSLFQTSEERLRRPSPHPDMEAALARIDAKLAPAKGHYPSRTQWHGVLAAARTFELWASNGLSEFTNRTLRAAANDLRRNAALIARDAVLLVTQDAEALSDSDGSPKGGDAQQGSVADDSAAIAQNQSEPSS